MLIIVCRLLIAAAATNLLLWYKCRCCKWFCCERCSQLGLL